MVDKPPFEVGDQVTVLPPWDKYPVIISMQHYVNVAEVLADGSVMVRLDATMPPGQLYGPFVEVQLRRGWRKANGRWHVG